LGGQNSHHFRIFVSESVKQSSEHRQQLEANQHVQVLYYEKKLERMVENMVYLYSIEQEIFVGSELCHETS